MTPEDSEKLPNAKHLFFPFLEKVYFALLIETVRLNEPPAQRPKHSPSNRA